MRRAHTTFSPKTIDFVNRQRSRNLSIFQRLFNLGIIVGSCVLSFWFFKNILHTREISRHKPTLLSHCVHISNQYSIIKMKFFVCPLDSLWFRSDFPRLKDDDIWKYLVDSSPMPICARGWILNAFWVWFFAHFFSEPDDGHIFFFLLIFERFIFFSFIITFDCAAHFFCVLEFHLSRVIRYNTEKRDAHRVYRDDLEHEDRRE